MQDKALFPDEYLAWWKVVQILEGHQEPDTQVESSPMAVDEQPSKPEPAGDEQPSQPAPSGQPLAAEEALSQQLTALHATAASAMSTDGPHAMQSQHRIGLLNLLSLKIQTRTRSDIVHVHMHTYQHMDT